MVPDLSIDKSTGTYIYQYKNQEGKWKKKTFGNDLARAVRRYEAFRGWEVNKFKIKKPDDVKSLGVEAEFTIKEEALYGKHGEQILDAISGIEVNEIGVPEELFWERVKKEISENPKRAADMTGIEELSYLHKLKKPTIIQDK